MNPGRIAALVAALELSDYEWAPDLGTTEQVQLSDDGRALLRLLDALKEATEDA